MPVDYAYATPMTVPTESAVLRAYPSVQLADAYAIRLPSGASREPELLARFMFAHQPAWIGMLMRVRDTIVSWFGLKTAHDLATLALDAHAERIGIFKIYSRTGTEIVLGEDDKHLDFRVSVLCARCIGTEIGARLTVSTVVHCHNRLGRFYLLAITPFHRMVVKSTLGHAARIGWPRDGAATGK